MISPTRPSGRSGSNSLDERPDVAFRVGDPNEPSAPRLIFRRLGFNVHREQPAVTVVRVVDPDSGPTVPARIRRGVGDHFAQA